MTGNILFFKIKEKTEDYDSRYPPEVHGRLPDGFLMALEEIGKERMADPTSYTEASNEDIGLCIFLDGAIRALRWLKIHNVERYLTKLDTTTIEDDLNGRIDSLLRKKKKLPETLLSDFLSHEIILAISQAELFIKWYRDTPLEQRIPSKVNYMYLASVNRIQAVTENLEINLIDSLYEQQTKESK